jgi:DivIVA domain-containing protein
VTILTTVDRDAIERRDFPVGRRGYDQAAVDEHLRRVADEIETLKAGGRPAPTPLSAGTSEQVRAILEAAESGAAELREQAGREAGEHVAKVEDAAGGMLAKLDQLESELKTLLEALRRSGEQLNQGLAQLHEQVTEFGGEPGAESAAAPVPEPEPVAEAEPEPVAVPEPEPVAEAEPEPADVPSRNGDEAGARLIALNMALSGTPRDETARFLAEHYDLADAEALLDDVYSQVGP